MREFTVSVVIPVFNEESAIGPCLDALLAQTSPPLEIIVVDNNSTDNTLAVLERYDGRIRVLHESQSGVVFARTRGFDAARGDIIGRIDADSRVTPGWIAQLQRIFHHHSAAAVVGSVHYYDMPPIFNTIDNYLRHLAVVKKDDSYTLHGTNMAIRREAWEMVRSTLCIRNGVHEDLDLAIHLQKMQQKILFSPSLITGVSARRLDDSVATFRRYILGNLRTYETHHVKRKRTAWLAMMILLLFHAPARAVHRGYDPAARQLSLHKMLFARPVPRKNPLDG